MIRRDFILALPAASLAIGGLSACSRAQPTLSHDFYVWQRAWKAPLDHALHDAAADVRAWRILGLHLQGDGRAQMPDVHLEVVRATGNPVILVVRIEGSLQRLDEVALPRQIGSLVQTWAAHGLQVRGLEIDHDCATSQLDAYAQWLARLRAGQVGTRLSITTLPTWMQSPSLAGVLASVDEAVLQVHAVQRPSAGLFDMALAKQWIKRFAELSPRPFRVALPCYSSRAGFNEWGELVAVESETPVGLRSSREQELSASPYEVAGLLAWMQENAPSALAGTAWFRLPTIADQRAWKLATWRAVIAGRPMPRTPQAFLRVTSEPELFDVVLDNPSPVDVDLPAGIGLPSRCVAADGRQGYALDLLSGPPRLARRQAGWLRPGSTLVVGWIRCKRRIEDVVLPTQVS